MNRRYFPGLNALRAFAALSVLVDHLTAWSQLPIHIDAAFLDGSDAVTLFFVLSGFLIGHMLLTEKSRTGSIHMRGFYGRRVRRILPLYLLIITLTLLLLPGEVPAGGVVLSLSFMPEMNIFVLGSLIPLWSVGVEEKFYLFAPLLLRRFNVPKLALAVIVIRAALVFLFREQPYVTMILGYWRFDAMMLGVVGAWLVLVEHPALKVVYRLEIPALLVALPIIVFSTIEHVYLWDIGIAALSLIVILNVATNPTSRLRINRGPLDSMGKVSYGIYVFHLLFIVIATRLPVTAFAFLSPTLAAAAYVLSYFGIAVIGPIAAAYLSHRYFETPILNYRRQPSVAFKPASAD